jgi:hypothetical protein
MREEVRVREKELRVLAHEARHEGSLFEPKEGV